MMFFTTKSKFDKVVMPHVPGAYNLARWLLRSDSDAEDVVQESCLRAYEHLDELRGADARRWLLAIVRNSAYSALRKRRAQPGALSLDDLFDDASSLGSQPGAETAALESISLQELRAAIDRLPHEFREVVVLRDLEELSYLEIAGVIGAPVGTVMSRLSRARRRLRSIVADQFTENGEMRS
jgi:RNA polymerase sigma-70 factor (ECF subfamily)